MFDLIIIGGGPAGYHAAELASHEGLKTLLFEKRAIGGVCLNEGCIPSKALLYSAKLFDIMNGYGASYGASCENPKLDYKFAVARKDKVVKKLAGGIEAALKKGNVELVRAGAKITGRIEGGFKAEADGMEYQGAKLLLCAGSEPVMPPVKGIEKAMTNREILALTEVPKSLAVIGGGVIGLEMASLFLSAGSQVTVYEMADKIAGPTDREISGLLQKHYEKKGVCFHLGSPIEDIDKLGGEEKVLCCVGRRPVTAGLGLESIGLLTERGAVVTDGQMKTNIPGVFAAGDINGKSMLAHTAYREAEVAVNTICGRKDTMEYNAIPSVIYTNPEAAGVGETLESAQKKGIQAREQKLPMMYSGRYMAENERGEGICKLVWDGNRLIGVHMLGNPASEIISAASAFISREVSLEQMKKVVFPHPTVGEILHEAFFAPAASGGSNPF